MQVLGRARLEVLLAALLFSAGGALIKATTLGPWQVAALRSAFGAATLLILIPGARRGWNGRTVLVGLAQGATLLLYAVGNKYTTAANMIFLQSTAPLYLLLIGPLLLGERIRRRELAYMVALAAGLAAFLVGHEAPRKTAIDPAFGNVLGVLSGLTWALTVAGLRWLARTEGAAGGSPTGAAASAAALGNLFVVVACVPFALPLGPVSTADFGLVLVLGVFQIGLAYVFMTRGVRHVPAFESGLLLLLEPVLNALWAWIVHGEVPGPFSALGGATILVATALYTLSGAAPRAASSDS